MSAGPEPQCVLAAGCELGEGPVWIAAEQALWFVDIKSRAIHRFEPESGRHDRWDAPNEPGFIAPRAVGGLVAGLKNGLHRFDPSNGAFEPVLTIEDPGLGNRLNDGFVDAQGRLWFGSMHDTEINESGALYRLDARGLALVDGGYCITNGPAISPGGLVLYHTDTLRQIIYAFDLAPDGSVANRRPFVRIEEGAGYPDGLSVDAEGCVWTGLFGGWAARRYAPTGELLQTVRFPTANVTKIAFGGSRLQQAYATTARKGLSAEALGNQPLAGGIFSFPVQTPGLPQHEILYL